MNLKNSYENPENKNDLKSNSIEYFERKYLDIDKVTCIDSSSYRWDCSKNARLNLEEYSTSSDIPRHHASTLIKHQFDQYNDEILFRDEDSGDLYPNIAKNIMQSKNRTNGQTIFDCYMTFGNNFDRNNPDKESDIMSGHRFVSFIDNSGKLFVLDATIPKDKITKPQLREDYVNHYALKDKNAHLPPKLFISKEKYFPKTEYCA